nr:hypothetical protein [Tanacetum cinerariifolium]
MMSSNTPRLEKSKTAKSRYRSPVSTTESPFSLPPSPISPNRNHKSKPSLKKNGLLHGVWPSSTPKLSKSSHNENAQTGATTLAEYLGNDRKRDNAGLAFLSKQRSCSEFNRFENNSKKQNNLKENHKPIFGSGSMRYTGKFRFPGRSSTSSPSSSSNGARDELGIENGVIDDGNSNGEQAEESGGNNGLGNSIDAEFPSLNKENGNDNDTKEYDNMNKYKFGSFVSIVKQSMNELDNKLKLIPTELANGREVVIIEVEFVLEGIIIKYLVRISKKARILELKRRHLKITVLTSYTPYPSRKIRRICACTSQETTKDSRPICRIQKESIRHIQLKNSTYLGLRKKYRLSLKNDMPP